MLEGIANGAINGMINGINSIGGGFGISIPTIPSVSLPKFAMGGFPEDGLFYKNDNEIITQLAGKSQVINSSDTYEMIKQAAYEGQLQAKVS